MNEADFEKLMPGNQKDIKEYLEIKFRLQSLTKIRIGPCDNRKAEQFPDISWKHDVYIQSNLYRTIDLMNIVELTWENKVSLGSYISARGIIENTAHLYDAYQSAKRNLESGNFDNLNSDIQKSLLGSRLP